MAKKNQARQSARKSASNKAKVEAFNGPDLEDIEMYAASEGRGLFFMKCGGGRRIIRKPLAMG